MTKSPMEWKLEEIRIICRLKFVEIYPALIKISSRVGTLEFGQFLPVNSTPRRTQYHSLGQQQFIVLKQKKSSDE